MDTSIHRYIIVVNGYSNGEGFLGEKRKSCLSSFEIYRINYNNLANKNSFFIRVANDIGDINDDFSEF